jgi:hypothetical protein
MGGCTGSSVIPRDKRRKSDEQRDCCDLLARVGKGTAVAVSPGGARLVAIGRSRILPGRELVTQRGNLVPVPPLAARSDAVAGSTLWPLALHPAKPSGSPKARRGHTAAGLGVEARRQALPTKNSSPS